MSNITCEAIGLLVANRAPEKDATCFFSSTTGQAGPLFAIWEPRAYPALREFAGKGNASPRKFLKGACAGMVAAPDETILMNCHTRGEAIHCGVTSWPGKEV